MNSQRAITFARSLVLVAVLALLPVTNHARAQEHPARPTAKEIRALLDAGDAEGAHERATIAAEYAPDDPDVLGLASVAAEKAGERDLSLWLAKRALQAARANGASATTAKTFAARIAGLDPVDPEITAAFDTALEHYLQLGQLAVKRKHWANAVELLNDCAGTVHEAAAAKSLATVYSKKKAVRELLDSGLDVPIAHPSKRSADWIAKNDAKHTDWDDAWEVKSSNYTVVTNIGWELANAMSDAMEQMNTFYRTVFRHKQRGGGTARCTIYAFKNHDEFLANVDEDQHDSAGYFSPGANTVHLFDPRPTGESISELWKTLFHEASHQFTEMIMADMVPMWMDEGTASYFEGAQLQPNGRVQTNLVVDAYLEELVETLAAGKPSVRQVIAYDQDESYDADYYPTGWGLVYFLRNYEDDAHERVYAPIYDKYLDAYRTGGKHDKFERFIEYFVTKAKQPGATTFEEFEARFREWIGELNALWTGGPEVAADLIARARSQHAAGKLDAAAETYRWALAKRPGSLTATFELAGVYADLDRDDAAFAMHRRVVEIARAGSLERDVADMEDTSAGALAELSLAKMAKIDGLFAERLETVRSELADSARAVAAAYVEAEHHDNAAVTLATAAHLLANPQGLVAERDQVVLEHGAEWRRRCRLDVSPGLARWETFGEWSGDGVGLSVTSEPLVVATYVEDMPASYRFEVNYRPSKLGKAGWMAIIFGLGGDGVWDVLGVYDNATVDVQRCTKTFEQLLRLPDTRTAAVQDLQLAVDVDGDTATFWVDGKKVGALEMGATALRGRVGVVCADGAFEIRDPVLIQR